MIPIIPPIPSAPPPSVSYGGKPAFHALQAGKILPANHPTPPSHEAVWPAFLLCPSPFIPKSKITTYNTFTKPKTTTYINFSKLKISTYNSKNLSGPPKYRQKTTHFLLCFTHVLLCFNTLLPQNLHLLLYFLRHLPTQPNRYKLPNFLPILPKILPNRYNRYNPYFIIGPPLSTQNKDLYQFPKTKNNDLHQFPQSINNDLRQKRPAKNIDLQAVSPSHFGGFFYAK
jgi:hypothetical protein